MGGGTVFICSSKQLKDKVCIYMLFFNKKEVFPQWVCPSLYVQRQVGGGNKRRIFVKRVCKHVISCSAPTVLQISSCFSAALLPAYNILMHLFLFAKQSVWWKLCRGMKLCICSLKSARIRSATSAFIALSERIMCRCLWKRENVCDVICILFGRFSCTLACSMCSQVSAVRTSCTKPQ